MSDMKRRALRLAAAGFAVFPLTPNSKRPLPGSHGHRDASMDAFQVEEWWEATPEANIGLSPDACDPPLLIVDVDPKNGGLETLRSLRAKGLLPDTLMIETPSGGLHLYYRYPPDHDGPRAASSAGRVGPGLDVRAAGGYVVAPGSSIREKQYRVVNKAIPATAPLNLVHACGVTQERNPEADRWLVEPDLPHNVTRARHFLESTEPAVEGAGGHDWTYQTAAKCRDFGLSQDVALREMLRDWNDRCQPPWEYDELAAVVEHAYAYAKRPAGWEAADPGDLSGLIEPDAEEPPEDPSPAGPEAPGENGASRFRPVSLPELYARPPTAWLVKRTLPRRGLGMLIGPYSAYKSFLAVDLAMHVALGLDWMGLRTVQGPVVYVAGEGAAGLRWRTRAWLADRNIDETPETFRVVEAMPMFSETAQVQELLDEIAPVRPVLVVLDTVARALAGLDENSAKDGGLFVHHADQLWQRLGAFVLGIHHTGKDEAKGSRGTTALPAAMDTILQVWAVHARREAHLGTTKSKDGETWAVKRVFRSRLVDLGEDEDGDPVDSLAFRYDPAAEARSSDRDLEAAMRWDAAVRILTGPEYHEPMSTRFLAEAIVERTVAEEDLGRPGTDAYKAQVEAAKKFLVRHSKTDEGRRWILPGTEDGRNVNRWRPPHDHEVED